LSLADHRAISVNGQWFTPDMALKEHEASVAWLKGELTNKTRTVVVTHHAPLAKSIHPKYLRDPVTAGFASDLDFVTAPVTLWVHGHMHDQTKYVSRGTDVILHPRGYPGEHYQELSEYIPFEVDIDD
jgi:Icc-related predicted phosphoesterase